MTVSRISIACWIFFSVMCVAFLPLGAGILAIHALPLNVRVVLAVVTVIGVWWGPFVYAMYLSIAVMRNGDRRLLRRGIAGTAEVLSAKATNTVISEGEFDWQAPRVYKYGLRVSIPGRAPYETSCSICAAGVRQGSVVNVAVSRHNRKRVTIDVGQGGKNGAGGRYLAPGAGPAGQRFPAADARVTRDTGRVWPEFAPSRDNQRIAALAQLGQLRNQGILTDAEFAAQKARILAE
jgi:Short C-terminal domain